MNEQKLNVVGLANTYSELHAILRRRWQESGYTQDQLNAISGYADRFLGKLLQPKKSKFLNYSSWQTMLACLGLKIAVLEDPEQAAKIREKIRRCADVTACDKVQDDHAPHDGGLPGYVDVGRRL